MKSVRKNKFNCYFGLAIVVKCALRILDDGSVTITQEPLETVATFQSLNDF